jgi:hypothetical protein
MSSLYIYHAILRDIRRHRYDVFTRRAGATPLEKFAYTARAWWETSCLGQCTIPGKREREATSLVEISGNA